MKSFEETTKQLKRVRIPFTEAEDDILRNAVSMYKGNWEAIAEKLPGRNERQCRERWDNYLNPNLIKGEWTEEEDQFIMDCVEKYGRKWSKIETLFPRRSAPAIKNRFNILERREIKAERLARVPEQIMQDPPRMQRVRATKEPKETEKMHEDLKENPPKQISFFDGLQAEEFFSLFETIGSDLSIETGSLFDKIL